jgi:integrase
MAQNDYPGVGQSPISIGPSDFAFDRPPMERSLRLVAASNSGAAGETESQGDGDHEVGGKNLSKLALLYVTKRQAAGQINGRSAEQIRSRLLDFAGDVPANPRRVFRHHVETWMERPDLRPQYLRGRLSALRGFCRWCVAEGYMAKDPTLLVPMPKIPPQLPKRLTHDEAVALVDAVRHDRRTFLTVLLMLQEGLRRIEVSRLNVDDIDFAERSMTIRGKGGQGCETDALPITEETWQALTAYLAEEGHTHGPLIRNRVRKHGRCAPATISELVTQGMVDAGIKRPGDRLRTPHSCRHTMAHETLARTKNVRLVQQAMRHRSVRSTEVYLRGATEDLRPTMEGRRYAS